MILPKVKAAKAAAFAFRMKSKLRYGDLKLERSLANMKIVRIKTNKEDKKVFEIADQYVGSVDRHKVIKMPKPYTVLTQHDGTMYVSFCVRNWFEMFLCKRHFKDYSLEIEP